MATKTNVKLPEDVAAKFKYCGAGHKIFVLPYPLGGGRVDVETLSLATAEKIANKVHFLKRKPTPKARKKED
ncbi:MAG: hypothetical protein ACPG5W_00560 [Flavobacteriales bacterium]